MVNRLPLDRYLRGVVPWEMPEDWHREALKAQAVVARSYALATLKPDKLFDLYADTRSQVYGGIRAEEVTTNRAIAATAGRVLFWNGRVATTFYHSTSGGRTAPIAEVWPRATPLPYLVSVPDPYDRISKHHRWGPVLLTPGQIATEARRRGRARRCSSRARLRPRHRGAVKARRRDRTVLAQDFRRELDLRSTWFTVRVLRLERPPGRGRRRRPADGAARVRPRARRSGSSSRWPAATWTTVKRVTPRRRTLHGHRGPRRTTSYGLPLRPAPVARSR